MATRTADPHVIDLNSDLGEDVGGTGTDHDAAMLRVASSANVACGFHAGDPAIMRATVGAAVGQGVAVGAHVSYRDPAGFGRRAMDVPSDRLRAEVVYQLGALRGIAAAAGSAVTYVKPHGALYNTAAVDERVAADVAEAVASVDPALVMLGLPGSRALAAAEAAGLRVAVEAFADRAYAPDGTLVPRSRPGAVLTDVELVVDRVLRLVTEGTLVATDGSVVHVAAHSVCVHGDTPGAVTMARRVREALTRAGVVVRPFAPHAPLAPPSGTA